MICTEDLRAVLVDILCHTEALDKIVLTLDPISRSVTIVVNDLDDSWFQEIEPSNSGHPLNGQFLPRGAFLFYCPCGRMLDVSLRQGSRGDRTINAHTECLCGRCFDLVFGAEDSVEIKIT